MSFSKGVVQGVFRPGASLLHQNLKSRPGTIQPAARPGAIQPFSQQGVEAFQVNLRPATGGKALPPEVQAKMESAFNTDFSDVRIHVGREATSVGAIAYTHGSSIHFAPGQYNPTTRQGQQLLGHELTHVVQQRAGRVQNPFGSGVAVVQDRALEAEADRMGMKAAMMLDRPGSATLQQKRFPGRGSAQVAGGLPVRGQSALQPKLANGAARTGFQEPALNSIQMSGGSGGGGGGSGGAGSAGGGKKKNPLVDHWKMQKLAEDVYELVLEQLEKDLTRA